jgi:hypothetical protein
MKRLYLGDSKWVGALRKRFGIEMPRWAEMGEWDEIHERIRREHPLGWFLTEVVPDWIEAVHDFITSPYYNSRYYIRNRFIRRTHMLRTDCPLGEWRDMDHRILSALTNAIIDYVEIELALKSRWLNTDESKTAAWRKGRCPELGLEYLKWEMTLDDPDLDEYSRSDHQAVAAREVKAIYDWAKSREDRPDPMDASGWSDYCSKWPRAWRSKDRSPEQEAECDAAHQRLREIEKAYSDEDTDMLIRLMKIRESLWT